MAINKVILVGNLGSDPEVRELDGGKKVANFSIATTERYTDRDGQKKEITEWHRLELWDGLAGVAQQYLHKGDKVYVEGKLKTDTWQDKDGVSRSTTKIRVERLEIMSNRNAAETYVAATNGTDNDDLPF
jgi:single-strand DNA-binding protein